MWVDESGPSFSFIFSIEENLYLYLAKHKLFTAY